MFRIDIDEMNCPLTSINFRIPSYLGHIVLLNFYYTTSYSSFLHPHFENFRFIQLKENPTCAIPFESFFLCKPVYDLATNEFVCIILHIFILQTKNKE